MPTLADLRGRLAPSPRPLTVSPGTDETLVIDTRSKMSPAQIVEQKLRLALLAGRGLTGSPAGWRRQQAHP